MANKLPEFTDPKTGQTVRPYTSTVFARTDLIQDGSNGLLWSNWSPSPDIACSNAQISSIDSHFIISRRSVGDCAYGHDITMVEKY